MNAFRSWREGRRGKGRLARERERAKIPGDVMGGATDLQNKDEVSDCTVLIGLA
jgi:hypothetical protein